jgi:diguanylate cyclase (GGDEF)-like protein
MTLSSLNSSKPAHEEISEQSYEPWLFQKMLDELGRSELGVGFIYSVLDLLAARYELTDAVVVLVHESFGTQTFRLGHQSVSSSMAAELGNSPGVFCVPDVVPEVECDAVRSARYGWAFTLVLCDLNNFKAVNDSAGHAFGDQLLRQFGFALRLSVRNGDTAARIGGDEFGVILNNAEGNESAGFTDRLRSHLALSGSLIDFTIGTATSPRDSTDPVELYRIADGRLYEKKGVILR